MQQPSHQGEAGTADHGWSSNGLYCVCLQLQPLASVLMARGGMLTAQVPFTLLLFFDLCVLNIPKVAFEESLSM